MVVETWKAYWSSIYFFSLKTFKIICLCCGTYCLLIGSLFIYTTTTAWGISNWTILFQLVLASSPLIISGLVFYNRLYFWKGFRFLGATLLLRIYSIYTSQFFFSFFLFSFFKPYIQISFRVSYSYFLADPSWERERERLMHTWYTVHHEITLLFLLRQRFFFFFFFFFNKCNFITLVKSNLIKSKTLIREGFRDSSEDPKFVRPMYNVGMTPEEAKEKDYCFSNRIWYLFEVFLWP